MHPGPILMVRHNPHGLLLGAVGALVPIWHLLWNLFHLAPIWHLFFLRLREVMMTAGVQGEPTVWFATRA
jgi:hypothetical protein